ncbi:hypothetical protein ABZ958_30970 [Streptomyces sp. NPDC046237]|uniref:hypothetical protein n=1 Tax=Streptomyces sp. NPDC046237 TaxID=3154914 RepID=UPI0033F72ACD
MNLRSSWVAETGQTREDTRLNQIGATTATNPVQVRSGILPGSYDGRFRLSGFWLAGANAMSATVHEGRAVIQGEISQGVYPVALPTAQTITFAPGDAQYGRIDLVVAKVYDNLYDSSKRNEATIEIIQGVPGQSPQAPAIPPRSLALYEVTVVAGVSAGNGGINWNTALKDLRTPVVSLGGILPVEGQAFPGAYPGQYQDSGGALQRWDGGAWVPYPSALGGIVPNSAGTLTASYTGQYRDSSGGQLQRWSGTAWEPAFPGPYFNDTLDDGYTTSTAWVNTLTGRTGNPVVTFVAPASRQAILTFGSRIQLIGSGAGVGFMGVKVTQGATVHRDVSDAYAVVAAAPGNISTSTTQRLHTLTPGATYTVTPFYRSSNTALQAWFNNTFVQVTPQL